MLFRRRQPLRLWERIRHMLWPQRGWKRAALYVWHRLARLQDSAHGVAAGLASGIAISFTPFMGFHLIGAAALAWATRGNMLAALLGTMAGNPWTFPIIWLVTYRIGAWLLDLDPALTVEHLSLGAIVANPLALLKPLLLPMTLGGLPLALLSWFIIYWPIRYLIERYRSLRQIRLKAVREKLSRAREAVKRSVHRA